MIPTPASDTRSPRRPAINPQRTRASVLIVAMILAVLIAIALTSSIQLALNSMNLAEC
jgi:hypothetical protein